MIIILLYKHNFYNVNKKIFIISKKFFSNIDVISVQFIYLNLLYLNLVACQKDQTATVNLA